MAGELDAVLVALRVYVEAARIRDDDLGGRETLRSGPVRLTRHLWDRMAVGRCSTSVSVIQVTRLRGSCHGAAGRRATCRGGVSARGAWVRGVRGVFVGVVEDLLDGDGERAAEAEEQDDEPDHEPERGEAEQAHGAR